MKKILAIPGSIRKNSFNKQIARVLDSLSDHSFAVSVFELDSLPMFSEDLESNLPQAVKNLIASVKTADAVIFVTPEYNNMIPGVLKNACDWLSRSYAKEAVLGKPVAITGATIGSSGTVMAQNQMLLLASLLGFNVDANLRLPISQVQTKLDSNGQLIDDQLKEKLTNFLHDLVQKINF